MTLHLITAFFLCKVLGYFQQKNYRFLYVGSFCPLAKKTQLHIIIWLDIRYINQCCAGLGIRSFAQFAQIEWATVSDSLRSLKTNERLSESLRSLISKEQPWANRSDRSRQMSDCEQIAQFAHIKRAIVSESIRSLRTNERPWAIC